MRIKKKNLIFEERVKAKMEIPKAVMKLYKIFTKNGFLLYIVGGAVRDLLTHSKIKDYDLATDATVEEVEAMMVKNGISTKATGTRFTVQNAWLDNEWFEIATFREDSEGGDGRRPDSVTYSDINGDAQRRDLTINALYYDIKTKEIIDLVGGMDDIKNHVVRTVGDANDRFGEDRLRILRAIRFTARVGSNLDPAIDKAIKQDNSLELLKAEAIMEEFKKGVKQAKSTRHYLALLGKYGLFEWVLRGFDNINKNYVETNELVIVMTSLLINNDPDETYLKLMDIKYGSTEAAIIKLFMTLYKTPLNKDNFIDLKKAHQSLQENGHLSNNTFKEFVSIMDMDMNLHYKFMEYNFRAINRDYVVNNVEGGESIEGEELGDKIKELKIKDFFNSL
jgi:tRNA nucleotidyltransferase/poly(A) polymerase